ncbi:D-alanyl-D-alanine carboxypeptidase/D-alanyl-D-alanine-endopeptidase [Microlunatus sp. Gsoil 973]|uniref:D-alanyl-D-alanine carboxypeptidase/D-alanyl-D-alanine endopeptidase n=1 Tax=Microlunatus sp. Gsoil 973 TaxID=2672569 RepID=UPI0012B4F89A|nr:D-alanyl-D-alanine carboxypeptidase/D-alanyl-D-alanine-endopeptidase [Microlunatus sp. Gsoil 973]QGN33866.1 D-alanyl-D-alanine carboxypeptidase/D-alanyl-D-alanine-endopeptidase [Microlunatus sp. Gsoil 973]
MAARRVKVVGGAAAAAVVVAALAGFGVVRLDTAASSRARSAAPSTPSRTVPTPVGSIAVPSPTPEPETSIAPVLAQAGPPAASDPGEIATRVASAGQVKGARISAAVMSAQTGKLLYNHDADTALIPASVTKLLTTSAALKLLGPQHRFRTSVVDASTTRHGKKINQVDLVGGGDPYLTVTRKQAVEPGQASLEALATSTAKQLKADDLTRVRLGYDASLFRGPAWNPTWPSNYTTVVTRTTALWANEGRLYGSEGPRQSDPAESAADDFAALLRKRGIKITSIEPAKAPATADELAGIDSLPLSTIVEKLLMASDNDAAEVIARQVAVADGKPGTITDAVNSIKKVLSMLGAWAPGTRIYDGSGLSRDGRIPAQTLVKVLRLGIAGDQPALAPVFTGLPVAGVEGSLHYRFDESRAEVGRGLVRAKTGTLTGVHSLAGYSYTRDGELLIFAFVVNGARNDYSAVVWLDRAAAAVASCGCTS